MPNDIKENQHDNCLPNSTHPQALLDPRGLCNLSSPGRWSPVGGTGMDSKWPKAFMLKISNNQNILISLGKRSRLSGTSSPCRAVGGADGSQARCARKCISTILTCPRQCQQRHRLCQGRQVRASLNLTWSCYWSHLFLKKLLANNQTNISITSVPLTDLSREIFLKITWFGVDLLAAILSVPGNFFHRGRYVRC